MITIRQSQVDALAALSRRRFVADAAEHLRRAHPERWGDATNEALVAWVQRRLARGEALGLIEELALLRHLEVASRLDEPFADSVDALAVLNDFQALRNWPEPMPLLELLNRSTDP